MPTLVRFLTVVLVLAALGGAAMIYLAYMVQPNTREMTIRIPASKLTPQQ
jgi:phage shock protein PspC (stress-responsive transcriptional regulator)